MKIKKKLLLTPKDVKPSFNSWEVKGIFNPAAIRLPNKKILLYARIAERQLHKNIDELSCPIIISKKHYKYHSQNITESQILRKENNIIILKDGTCRLPTISHFRKVILDESGFEIEKIDQYPVFTGMPNESEYGVEDPRITLINNIYYMTYVGISLNEGISTYLASSKNLTNWKRLGLIFREQNKDVVLFPNKIKGKYVALNRPESFFEFSKSGIWISYSPDLIFWGGDKKIIKPRGESWESKKIGSGCIPIKTKKGWLLIYHGVKKDEERYIYNAGAILLDLKNPEKIVARSPLKKPLFNPTPEYEENGFIKNVVFPTGAILDLNGEDLLVYSGEGDSNISVRKISLEDILNSLNPYKKVHKI